MLYLIGIIISFFLFFLLIGKKNKVVADKILAFWLFIIGCHLFFYYLTNPFENSGNTLLFSFFFGLPFLYGPLLFLYTKYRIHNSLKLEKIDLIHFMPIILIYIIIVPDFRINPENQNLIYTNGLLPCNLMKNIVFILILISGIGYSIASLILIKKYKQNINLYFSNTNKINLNWLRLNVYGILLLWLILFYRNDCYTFAFISLFVLSIGYFGIKQVGIFNDYFILENTGLGITESQNNYISIDDKKHNESLKVVKKYKKSTINQNEGIKIQEKLQLVMSNEKLFLNPKLTLSDIAKKIDVHPNILSQVINSFEQKTFYDFINGLRIEYFKELITIEENQKYTLLTLAFDCGFNSKSSFNKYFKKVTNLTPSEYLNNLNVSKHNNPA